MTKVNISIISPTSQGGVYDFSEKIVESLFPYGKRYSWSQDSSTEIESAMQSDCLYLQYSGYGYAKRGAPLGLLQALEHKRHKIPKLGIFFHELYAFGPPWSSAFWLSPLQRQIARRLAELSDFWVTNREGSAQWLRRYAGDKPHVVLPTPSNVGEMPFYSPVRVPKVVIFGGASLRHATYRAAGDALFAWAKRQDLQIHDIGPEITDPMMANRLVNEGVIIHGRLEHEEISRLLANAMFGVVVYPVEYAAKSGVLAAYCAHGICPVLISNNYPATDRLIKNQHYLAGIPGPDCMLSIAKEIGETAWNWYRPHRLASHIASLNNFLG